MRRDPLLPLYLTRFNYWNYDRVKPTPLEEMGVNPSRAWSFHERFRKKFASHLYEGPCGERLCRWDVKLIGRPQAEWPYVLLESYILMDREWRKDELAWRIFRKLPADAQARLKKLDQKQRGQCRRGWECMLEIIARDQKVFKYIIAQKASGRLDEVSENFALSEGSVRKIYTAYHSQATRLLGKESPLEQLAKKPSMKEILARLQGEPRKRRSTTAHVICQTWDEVFAWLALALRNLKRYRSGHPPLPWTPPR